jgi:hypothetical protein
LPLAAAAKLIGHLILIIVYYKIVPLCVWKQRMIHAVSKRQNGNDQFCLFPWRILLCPLALFINSFMNNKRHVRETENLLHGLILVDTPFKQVWIHGCNIVIVDYMIALSVRVVPYRPCRALLHTDYAFVRVA